MCSTDCHRQKQGLKDKPQQAAQNQQTEAQKMSPTLKITKHGSVQEEKNKLNMSFSRSTRLWLYRLKDLMHFCQTHNLCESVSCEWPFFSSICKCNMV